MMTQNEITVTHDTTQNITQNITQKKSWYTPALDKAVDNIGYSIVRLAPLFGSVPAIATLLEAANYSVTAWLVVITVELMGYAIGEKSVEALALKVVGPKWAAAPILVYAFVIECLMLGYKVIPAWSDWHAGVVSVAYAIQSSGSIFYPVFTAAGAGLFAVHQYLLTVRAKQAQEAALAVAQAEVSWEVKLERERVLMERDNLEWEDQREFKRAQQRIALQAREARTLSTLSPVTNTFQESVQESVDESLIEWYKTNPGARLAEAGRALGRSESYISKRVAVLVQAGILRSVQDGKRKIVTHIDAPVEDQGADA